MSISPIHSVIENLSDTSYIATISNKIRLCLSPAGQLGDKVQLEGDLFTLVDRPAIAEMLSRSIVAGRIKVTYYIDRFVNVVNNFDTPLMSVPQAIKGELKALAAMQNAEVSYDVVSEPVEERVAEPVSIPETPAEKPAEEEEKPAEEGAVSEPTLADTAISESEQPSVENNAVTEPEDSKASEPAKAPQKKTSKRK